MEGLAEMYKDWVRKEKRKKRKGEIKQN